MGFSTLLDPVKAANAQGSWFDANPVPTNSAGGSPTFNERGGALVQGGGTPGQVDDSFGGYGSDPTVQAVQQGLQQGLTGDSLIQFVKQRVPNAQVTWDAQRGNVDISTGGSNGLQIDTNGQGVWGVHPYNDAGSTGSLGSLAQGGPFGAFTPPSLADAQNSPGFQYGLSEALRGLQSSAAAKGTLLNGRTNEAMGKSLVNYAGLTLYPQAFNQALQTNTQNFGINQGNFGNLYNLANLGASTARNG